MQTQTRLRCTDISQLPSLTEAYFALGLSLLPTLQAADQFVFADHAPRIGETSVRIGDSFRFEEFTEAVTFADLVTPVVLPDAPPSPARGVLVRVVIDARVAGQLVVENADYLVDSGARTVQALTTWDGRRRRWGKRSVHSGSSN